MPAPPSNGAFDHEYRIRGDGGFIAGETKHSDDVAGKWDEYKAMEPDKKYISGSNTVGYKVLESNKVMQIDLQKPMNITSVTSKNKELKYTREGNAYFIELRKKQKKGDVNYIKINYEGFPKEAATYALSMFKGERSCQALARTWLMDSRNESEVQRILGKNAPTLRGISNISSGRQPPFVSHKITQSAPPSSAAFTPFSA